MGTNLMMVIPFTVVPITVGAQHISRGCKRASSFVALSIVRLCAYREFQDEAHRARHPEHGKCRPEHQWCDRLSACALSLVSS